MAHFSQRIQNLYLARRLIWANPTFFRAEKNVNSTLCNQSAINQFNIYPQIIRIIFYVDLQFRR